MTEYNKNYKGIKYTISHKFILDMENNYEIDIIKQIEKIIDENLETEKENE